MNLKSDVVIPYSMLDNIDKAVDLFMKHFENKNKIEILVDSDPDGYCSAAMMYSYIKQLDNSYPVEYILHKRAKSHGLDDDVVVPEGYIFVMGDNRSGSSDSREFGCIPLNKVEGRVTYRIWPFSKFGAIDK